MSSSAIGLYIPNTRAFPIPNSARLNTCKMELNTPLSPLYSAPSVLIRVVCTANGNKIIIILLAIPVMIFFFAFLVLSSFILYYLIAKLLF